MVDLTQTARRLGGPFARARPRGVIMGTEATMLEHFWTEYERYRGSGSQERVTLQASDGASFELYHSMSTVRARYRPPGPGFSDASAFGKAAEAFAALHGFLTDFRDESYVLTNSEGVYYARLRPGEVLFTPERFEENPRLLEEVVRLYPSPAV